MLIVSYFLCTAPCRYTDRKNIAVVNFPLVIYNIYIRIEVVHKIAMHRIRRPKQLGCNGEMQGFYEAAVSSLVFIQILGLGKAH